MYSNVVCAAYMYAFAKLVAHLAENTRLLLCGICAVSQQTYATVEVIIQKYILAEGEACCTQHNKIPL